MLGSILGLQALDAGSRPHSYLDPVGVPGWLSLIKHPTLDFGSGCDLILGSSLSLGSLLSGEPASPSPSAVPLACAP